MLSVPLPVRLTPEVMTRFTPSTAVRGVCFEKAVRVCVGLRGSNVLLLYSICLCRGRVYRRVGEQITSGLVFATRARE